MSDMKNERVANPQWKKATLWASAVVLVLILGMALLVIFTPKKDETSPAAGPSAPASTVPSNPATQDGCNVPAGDTSATPKMPDDLRWEAGSGTGNARYSSGLYSCGVPAVADGSWAPAA